MQFFKVKEKTGNFILRQGKIYVFERSRGKVKLHVRCMCLTESINLWVERLTKGGRVEVIIRTRLWNCTFSWSRKFYVCQENGRKFKKLMIVVTMFEIHQIKSGDKTYTHEKQELENRVFWNLSKSLDKSNFISQYLTKLNRVHKKQGKNLSVK